MLGTLACARVPPSPLSAGFRSGGGCASRVLRGLVLVASAPRPAVPVFFCGFVAAFGGFPCLLSFLLLAFRCRLLLCLRPFRTRLGWCLPVFRLGLSASLSGRVGLVPSRLGLAVAFGLSWRLARCCAALSLVAWVCVLLSLWFGCCALPVTPALLWRLVSLAPSRLLLGSVALIWFPRFLPPSLPSGGGGFFSNPALVPVCLLRGLVPVVFGCSRGCGVLLPSPWPRGPPLWWSVGRSARNCSMKGTKS